MIRLQLFGHRVSAYDRPTEPWICGWAAIGEPCRVGPDRHGRCQATFECQPQRKQDRWECARPGTAGGSCEEGPRPEGTCCRAIPRCVPVRYQRARRGQITALSFAILLGLLALVLGGKSAAWLVEPGPLAVEHGGIKQCSACHTSFANGPVGWLHAAFATAPVAARAQPCLACHDIGKHPLAAHGLESSTLTKLGAALLAPPRVSGTTGAGNASAATVSAFALPEVARGDIACSACHREHRGGDARLTAVHSATCQTCHAIRFASLADGHPDFVGFPFRRRMRLIFDHAKHFDQHFGQSSKALVPAACTGCHALGPGGAAMVVKPFAVTCAGCHLDDIKERAGADVQGIPVLGVPGLDLETLRAHEAAIGDWPAAADGDLAPFLRFLLSRRPDTAADLATLGSASLGDLSRASTVQIAAAARIAWAIKELLLDLSIKGPAVLAQAAVGDSAADLNQSAALVGGLPPDAIKTADQLWFPDLADEVTRHRAGERVPMKASKASKASGAAPSQAPAGGQGAITGTGNGAILGGGSNGSILGGEGTLGSPAIGPAAPGGAPAAEPAQSPEAAAAGQGAIAGTANGAILGGGGGLLGAAPPPSPPPGGNNASILGGQGILGGSAPPPAAAASPTPQERQPPRPMESEAWTGIGGGWYRLDYYLYYRPADHADRFLRGWLDITGQDAREPNKSARVLFEHLSNPTAPGACGKCHSVDRGPDGASSVEWLPFGPDPEQHDFTKFSHLPHLSLLGSTGCKTCHQVSAAADFAGSYKSGNPFVFAASFKPISRELCASCHVAGQASAACTACHNYHIGHFPPTVGVTMMHTATPSPRIFGVDHPPASPVPSRTDAGARSRLADRLPLSQQ